MKEYLDKLYQSPAGWFCIKLFFSLFWLDEINYMLWTMNGFMLPVGICKLISCSVFGITSFKIAFLAILFVTLYFYLKSEKYAIPSLSILLLFSIWIISAHESTGVFLRASLFSMVWAGQLMAYLIHKNNSANLSKYRHHFVVQLITATYCLAAVSKLMDTGWNWPAQGAEYLPLSVLKAYIFDYFDTGNSSFLSDGFAWANKLIEQKNLVFVLLFFTLIIELISPMANLDVRLTFIIGLLLFLMHRGIDFSMHIVIGGTYYSMMAFMLNPLGIIYFLFKKYAEK